MPANCEGGSGTCWGLHELRVTGQLSRVLVTGEVCFSSRFTTFIWERILQRTSTNIYY